MSIRWLPLIFLLGCGEDLSLRPVTQVPDLTVRLPSGETLGFLVDDDGSVGILSELPIGGTGGSVLDLPELDGATPAEIFLATTAPGTALPEALARHHDGLVGDGKALPLDPAQGWALGSAAAAPPSPCTNEIFEEEHCDHPEYEGAVCKLNTQGSWQWNVWGADRYKAGFCLQAGQARSWLYYFTAGAECTYFEVTHFIWGADSYWEGTRYAATTYRTYTWWRGSGGARRFFSHFAGDGIDGAVFDWGTRWSNTTCD